MKPRDKNFLSFCLALLLILSFMLFLHAEVAQAQNAPDQTQIIQGGLAYIKSQQQPSGGMLGFSGIADPDTTARSVLAFASAGKTPGEVVSLEGSSMMDYLSAQAITFTHDTTGTLFPGRAGELLAAVSLAREDPTQFGGMDLVKELGASFHTDTGAYSTSAKQDFASGEASDLYQAWVILGLSLAGQPEPKTATQFLLKSQAEDGSWGAGDPDTTALAMTALLASRNVTVQDQAIQRAVEYFHSTQAPSGGWKPAWDTDPLNADSTGWIIQALVSAGEDMRSQSWTINNTNPVEALLGMQKPDGAIGGTYANTYSTAEAILGLSGVPLANLGITPASHRAGLAVFSGNNSLFTTCISFTQNSITGLELLQQSGLALETATNPTQGTAVCKIGDVGDPANNCFGSMPDYWAYWQMGKNGWEYSPVGADQSLVMDGGVYAWSWGTGDPPPPLTFQNVCEGVAFVLPTTTATSSPPTQTSLPSPAPTLTISLSASQPAAAPLTAGTRPGNYIAYAVVILALGLVILYFILSRRG